VPAADVDSMTADENPDPLIDCEFPGPTESERAALPPGYFTLPRGERLRIVQGLVRRSSQARQTAREVIANWDDDGDPAVIQALTIVAEGDPDTAVIRYAAHGLSRMRDESAIAGLLPLLRSPDRATRAHAVGGLGRLRARAAVPDLVQLLDDWYSCTWAARALVEIRDERGLEPLRHAATRGWPWRRKRLKLYAAELESALG
jgi:HEAT repeats